MSSKYHPNVPKSKSNLHGPIQSWSLIREAGELEKLWSNHGCILFKNHFHICVFGKTIWKIMKKKQILPFQYFLGQASSNRSRTEEHMAPPPGSSSSSEPVNPSLRIKYCPHNSCWLIPTVISFKQEFLG